MQALIKSVFVIAAISGAPVLAQDMPEVAEAATPIDVEIWQRRVARDLPAESRMLGVPESRIGLFVDASGRVIECRAFAMTEGSTPVGQELCPPLIEHARFSPALDASGVPIPSVFVAYFPAIPGTAGQREGSGEANAAVPRIARESWQPAARSD